MLKRATSTAATAAWFILTFPLKLVTTVVGIVGKIVMYPIVLCMGGPGKRFKKYQGGGEACLIKNTLRALEWAEHAYSEDGSGEGWVLVSSMATGTQVIVGYVQEESALVVAWRGTEVSDMKDVATDLRVGQVDPTNYKVGEYEGVVTTDFAGTVHRGFYDAYLSVMYRGSDGCTGVVGGETLTEVVERLMKDAVNLEKVIVTGHSLGGALATLFAVHFTKNYKDVPCELYTFGSPRVGDKTFSADANSIFQPTPMSTPSESTPLTSASTPHIRVVHESDIVPRIPYLLGTYRHTGTLVYITDGCVYVAEAHGVYIPTLYNVYELFDNMISIHGWAPFLKDHKTTQYRHCITVAEANDDC